MICRCLRLDWLPCFSKEGHSLENRCTACIHKNEYEISSTENDCNGCPSGVKNGEFCLEVQSILDFQRSYVILDQLCDCRTSRWDLLCELACVEIEICEKTIANDIDCDDLSYSGSFNPYVFSTALILLASGLII